MVSELGVTPLLGVLGVNPTSEGRPGTRTVEAIRAICKIEVSTYFCHCAVFKCANLV